MRKQLLRGVVLFGLTWATPAAACQSGALKEIFSAIGFVAVFFGALLLIGLAMERASKKADELPLEVLPTESAEHHDQQAARNRARARELESEAVLAESQLLLSLTQEELKELESLRAKKSTRRRKKGEADG